MKQNKTKRRYRLTLLPMGIILQADEGRTVMEVLAGSGIAMRSDCGREGRCGKCLVSVHPGDNLSPPMEAEIRLLDKRNDLPGTRLACQARIQGDITVTLPAWGQEWRSDPSQIGRIGKFCCRSCRETHIHRWHPVQGTVFRRSGGGFLWLDTT